MRQAMSGVSFAFAMLTAGAGATPVTFGAGNWAFAALDLITMAALFLLHRRLERRWASHRGG